MEQVPFEGLCGGHLLLFRRNRVCQRWDTGPLHQDVTVIFLAADFQLWAQYSAGNIFWVNKKAFGDRRVPKAQAGQVEPSDQTLAFDIPREFEILGLCEAVDFQFCFCTKEGNDCEVLRPKSTGQIVTEQS